MSPSGVFPPSLQKAVRRKAPHHEQQIFFGITLMCMESSMELGSQLRSGPQQPSSAVHELDSLKYRH